MSFYSWKSMILVYLLIYFGPRYFLEELSSDVFYHQTTKCIIMRSIFDFIPGSIALFSKKKYFYWPRFPLYKADNPLSLFYRLNNHQPSLVNSLSWLISRFEHLNTNGLEMLRDAMTAASSSWNAQRSSQRFLQKLHGQTRHTFREIQCRISIESIIGCWMILDVLMKFDIKYAVG